MGGRGSAERSVGGGKFNIPELSGSEKQISWAQDILSTPYNTMKARAVSLEKQAILFDKASSGGNGGNRERREAAAYDAAAKRYAKEIASLPKSMKSKDIIDKQFGIKSIANNILADEYEKHGFKKYEAGKL